MQTLLWRSSDVILVSENLVAVHTQHSFDGQMDICQLLVHWIFPHFPSVEIYTITSLLLHSNMCVVDAV